MSKPALIFRQIPASTAFARITASFAKHEAGLGLSIPDHIDTEFTVVAETPASGGGGGTKKSPLGICFGKTVWNEVHVAVLAKNPELPAPSSKGTALALLNKVEELSRRPQFNSCVMDTEVYSWQNVDYFKRLGFETFATQHDLPHAPHQRFFMQLPYNTVAAPTALPLSPALRGGQSSPSGLALREVTEEAEAAALRAQAKEWQDSHTAAAAPELPRWSEELYSVEASFEDGTVAGWTYGRFAWNEMYISLFAANQDVAGRGAGRQMVADWERAAREKGCERIGLVTMDWQAGPFYEKMGFTRYGTQKNIVVGRDRLFYQKLLK